MLQLTSPFQSLMPPIFLIVMSGIPYVHAGIMENFLPPSDARALYETDPVPVTENHTYTIMP
ncbi:MAG: hypothetical protein AAB425_11200, partial [Bdellovibrionota bacterium]